LSVVIDPDLKLETKMKSTFFMMSLLALVAVAPAAHALTVENIDKAPHTISITPTGGKAFDQGVRQGRSGLRQGLRSRTEW
jgi:hypothetical protein